MVFRTSTFQKIGNVIRAKFALKFYKDNKADYINFFTFIHIAR